MISKKNLQESIRNTFFKAINPVSTRSRASLLENIAINLKNIYQIDYAKIYLFNDWKKNYELVTDQTGNDYSIQGYRSDSSVGLYANRIVNNYGNMDKGVSYDYQEEIQSILIPLTATPKPRGLLIMASQQKEAFLSEGLARLIKQEIEQVLNLMNESINISESDRRNKFLLDLTTSLYSIYDQTEIVSKIIDSIQSFYPSFSYYLQLSQDYEVDESLPVKTIEYNDETSNLVSAEAFISGEVHLENHLNERQTHMYAPLVGKQGVYGVLQIITPDIVDFPQKEISFFTEFAHAVGKALEYVTLYQNSNKIVSDLKLINDTTHKLNSNLKRSEIIKLVRNEIMLTCHASQVGFIYFTKESKNGFDILKGSTAYFNTDDGLALSRLLLDQIDKTKDPVFSGDFSSETPFRSIMAIPMQHAGDIHGVIAVMHEDSYYFTFDRFKLMQSLIRHSTLALANTILKEQLEKAVITDYLTKLYSRNYLDDQINIHMQADEMGTLILFDLDDFKSINDTYGHHIGDDVIIQVAGIISQNMREEDIAARWGGEELAIYLPNTNIDRGVFLARLISKQVEMETDPRVTLSAGVSSWEDNADTSVRDFFIRADQALYEAKNYGKNCVVKKALGQHFKY